MEGSYLACARSGAPPLDLEVQQAIGSGGCHQFHWCCRGARIICVSATK